MALDYGCDFSLVLDLRRAKVLVKNFQQMDTVVKGLAALMAEEESVSGSIVIVGVKNRIGEFLASLAFSVNPILCCVFILIICP